MATAFDPYESWLGVSRQPLHPDRYRLLGLPAFSGDEAAIRQAAASRKALVEPHACGPQAAAAQRLLEELSLAETCLLDAGKRASYDALLRQQMAARGETNGGSDGGSAIAAQAAAAGSTGDSSADADIDDLLPPAAGFDDPAAMPVAVAAVPVTTAPTAVPVAVAAIPTAMPVAPQAIAVAPQAIPVAPYAIPVGATAAPAVAAAPMAGQAIPVAVAAIPMAAAADMPGTEESPAWDMPSPPTAVGVLPKPPAVSRTAQRKRSLTPLLFAIVAPVALVGVFGLAAFLVNESGQPPEQPTDDSGTEVASAAGSSDAAVDTQSPRPRNSNRRTQGGNDIAPPMSLAEAASRADVTPDQPGASSDDAADGDMPDEGMPEESMPDEDLPDGDTPDKTPEPQPEPEPEPDPEPAPEPEPAATSVADALMAARQALSQQKLATAKRQIDAATALAATEDEKAEVARVSAMYVYVEGFWNAVGEALDSLDAGLDFAYNDTRIGVVEKSGNRLVLRMDGENKPFEIDDLPTKLAVALSEHWFDKDDPRYLLSIGAYLVVHPKGDRDRAEALWLQAKLNGLSDEADLVMPELAVKIPAAGDAPAVAEAPTGDGRLKVPGKAEQATALEQVRTLYTDDYGAATDAPAKLLLAEKLLVTGLDSEGDPTLRFVLLVEARDLAAAAADVGTISRTVDALSEFYAVDRWEESAAAITAGAKSAEPEGCAVLAQAGLDLADEAVLTEEFAGALALVRAAQAAARESDDRELVKEAAARFKEIQAARRGA